MKNQDILIMPDIHGRPFWKKAAIENADSEMVFLGDYLDPYPYEGISREEAWANFMEIVSFKKSHMENIHLLLGNHDLAYLDPLLRCSRNDERNRARIQAFFRENLDLFDLAYETNAGGRRTLLSHAGINRKWIRKYPWIFDGDNVTAEALNNRLHDETCRKPLVKAMTQVSFFRGGWSAAGSVIWADVREFLDSDSVLPDILQIIGHTQQAEEPFKEGESVVCVDCRRPFWLTAAGEITEI